MKRSLNAFMILLILGLIAVPGTVVLAQSNLSLHIDQLDTTKFPKILIHLNAWDSADVPLAGLSLDDFTLQEDGGKPFQPITVQAIPDAPLKALLILDISNNMAGQLLDDEKQDAILFLKQLKTDDQAALIAFSNSVNPDPNQIDPTHEASFQSDLGPMSTLISGLQAQGDPHLYDALSKAVRMMDNQPEGHRIILLLSDGKNSPTNVSNPDEPIQLAQTAKVPVFVIGLGNNIDKTYLGHLASETGGLLQIASTSTDLTQFFSNIIALLKTEYDIGYHSALNSDGKSHTVIVTLTRFSLSASDIFKFTLLPKNTTLPTQTISPTLAHQITSYPAMTPTTTPISYKPANSSWHEYAGWLIAALVALGLGLLWTGMHRRRPKPRSEISADCGYDLTGKPGACPSCRGTKRRPKL